MEEGLGEVVLPRGILFSLEGLWEGSLFRRGLVHELRRWRCYEAEGQPRTFIPDAPELVYQQGKERERRYR